jgi:putative acetyltransferase
MAFQMPQIQVAQNEDHPRLLAVWLDSVRATHHFLQEKEIQALLPVVRDVALPGLEVWVLHDESLGIVGFMGLDGANVEALFISPGFFRRGGGKLLIEHARRLKGRLSVSVNEQNPSALAFYEANGFTVASRSPLDGQGHARPLLHLTE